MKACSMLNGWENYHAGVCDAQPAPVSPGCACSSSGALKGMEEACVQCRDFPWNLPGHIPIVEHNRICTRETTRKDFLPALFPCKLNMRCERLVTGMRDNDENSIRNVSSEKIGRRKRYNGKG